MSYDVTSQLSHIYTDMKIIVQCRRGEREMEEEWDCLVDSV